MFEVVKFELETMTKILNQFFADCAAENLINNINPKSMKLNAYSNQHWWVALADKKIVSMSGCYRSDDFGSNSWRLLFRSATLTQFRGRAGLFSKSLNHDFVWGQILPLQKALAQSHKANLLYFTTNTGNSGYVSSNRVDRFVERALVRQGLVREIEKNVFYGNCYQNIWEIL